MLTSGMTATNGGICLERISGAAFCANCRDVATLSTGP